MLFKTMLAFFFVSTIAFIDQSYGDISWQRFYGVNTTDGGLIPLVGPEEAFANRRFKKNDCLLPWHDEECNDDIIRPRTIIRYYYKSSDNKCHTTFYSGCGGNANNFDEESKCKKACVKKKKHQ